MKLSDANTRADILMRQLEAAWTNFDRRRRYEWKLSLAIWTAMAAFIALYLKGGVVQQLLEQQLTVLYAAAIAIVAIQVLFQVCVKLANNVDQYRAYFYEDLLNEATGACGPNFEETNVRPAINTVKVLKGWWTIFVHVGITIVLMLCAKFVISG